MAVSYYKVHHVIESELTDVLLYVYNIESDLPEVLHYAIDSDLIAVLHYKVRPH